MLAQCSSDAAAMTCICCTRTLQHSHSACSKWHLSCARRFAVVINILRRDFSCRQRGQPNHHQLMQLYVQHMHVLCNVAFEGQILQLCAITGAMKASVRSHHAVQASPHARTVPHCLSQAQTTKLHTHHAVCTEGHMHKAHSLHGTCCVPCATAHVPGHIPAAASRLPDLPF